MGKCIVKMSSEMFQSILTEGAIFPDRKGQVLKCVKGLPADAKLIDIHAVYFDSDEIALMFKSPSLPDGEPGQLIPFREIEFAICYMTTAERTSQRVKEAIHDSECIRARVQAIHDEEAEPTIVNEEK